MTYTVSPNLVNMSIENTVTEVAQRFNAALDRVDHLNQQYAKPPEQFRRLTPSGLAALAQQSTVKAMVETTGVNITHYGKEWARISRDGTVTKLDIEMAREIRRGVTWDTGRVVSINDVLCMLVTDAYEMGRLAATPKRDTVRVRDL